MDFLQENGLYLLFVGVMMFMMFRNGGCCGGHSGQRHGGGAHGSHGGGCGDSHSTNHRGADAQTVDMVKDPVCGMHINPSTAIHE
ncbi:hypothetical protein [Petroclostridium sp. X23]|uniref:hypothetical protein n=1 Tax=Petroclostridium sp. X23 TaxID=3045146 RepID=UPI0024AD6F85|nr:hypothetical protein [Petroclostridium sp. X23]WHH60157.1 hypothetical protein QKW49_05330 [Petroclostridium sp. X23]